MTEREITAFLKYSCKDSVPKGGVAPEVSLPGDRRVSGQAMVNLDELRKSKERGWLEPAAYLTGTVQVRAAGLDRGTWHFMTGKPYVMRLVVGLRKPRNAVAGIDVAGGGFVIGSSHRD